MKRYKTSYVGVYYRTAKKISGPGHEKIYYIVFKKDGKTREEKVGRQYADAMTPARAARIRAARIEGKIKSRKDIREEKREEAEKWTIGNLWKDYSQHLSGKTLKVDENRYEKWLKPDFENKEPKDLLMLDIDRLRLKKLKDKAPQTVRHILQLLSRIINYGVDRGLCAPAPFRIKMPKVDNEKTEDLTNAQLKALFEAMDNDEDQEAARFMRMVLCTGMRRGELFKLQWDDVNFHRGFITIKDPKGGKDQTIPLNDAARAVLEAQDRTDSPYVFPGRFGGERVDIKRSVNRIKERAGLPADFRPLHGLRHVYASMLASSGKVDLYTLQKLLTHKNPRMTQRYAHLRDEALKRAAGIASDIYKQGQKAAK